MRASIIVTWHPLSTNHRWYVRHWISAPRQYCQLHSQPFYNWPCVVHKRIYACLMIHFSAQCRFSKEFKCYAVQLRGNLILARPTFGEYTQTLDWVLSSARYSSRECTGKHSAALRFTQLEYCEVHCVHVSCTGRAQAQLFLTRVL